MCNSLLVVFLTGGAIALAQQPAVNIVGTWQLKATSFSAIVQIQQTGNSVGGQFAFSGNPCATTASFGGSINTLFSLGVTMSVNMNGQSVSFSGGIAADGNSMIGQYGASTAGCIGKGPFNWTASRTSTVIMPTISGVRHAASGTTGPIAPGEIISIFANPSLSPIGPTTAMSLQVDQNGKVANALGGVQVHFLGIGVYAPLTFVSAGQINAVVPYEVAGLTAVNIQVEYLGLVSDPFNLEVGVATPGLFTANGTGTGQAAALNDDGVTVNGLTHPEPRGGVIVLFVTGEGQTTPPGVSGKVTTLSLTPPVTPTPIGQVSVLINGQPASVVFSGEAPGLVSGVLQLNVRIPEGVSPGSVPVQVLVGENRTQSGVTVFLQ